MYIPKMNRIEDQEAIVAFMQQHNFATVVSVQGGVPVATHLPLTLSIENDQLWLRGHFAKANDQWQTIPTGEMLAIFSGPHAYISTTHYDKHESVPTWNYIAVHAYGTAQAVHFDDAPDKLEAMLVEMMNMLEAPYKAQWDSLPIRFREGMMQGIVGFEMQVTRLDAKAKLSQNKTLEEQHRIASSLLQHQDGSAVATGQAMLEQISAKE